MKYETVISDGKTPFDDNTLIYYHFIDESKKDKITISAMQYDILDQINGEPFNKINDAYDFPYEYHTEIIPILKEINGNDIIELPMTISLVEFSEEIKNIIKTNKNKINFVNHTIANRNIQAQNESFYDDNEDYYLEEDHIYYEELQRRITNEDYQRGLYFHNPHLYLNHVTEYIYYVNQSPDRISPSEQSSNLSLILKYLMSNLGKYDNMTSNDLPDHISVSEFKSEIGILIDNIIRKYIFLNQNSTFDLLNKNDVDNILNYLLKENDINLFSENYESYFSILAKLSEYNQSLAKEFAEDSKIINATIDAIKISPNISNLVLFYETTSHLSKETTQASSLDIPFLIALTNCLTLENNAENRLPINLSAHILSELIKKNNNMLRFAPLNNLINEKVNDCKINELRDSLNKTIKNALGNNQENNKSKVPCIFQLQQTDKNNSVSNQLSRN
ncbi:hypothetical protein L3V83_14330 [Thiotrichales bacterium 19X7-9]|nr:hypothetical protein [Thiotrichales bacterium 19X7-9]